MTAITRNIQYPRDCLGWGKLSEKQMAGVVRLVVQQKRLTEKYVPQDGIGCIIAGGGRYLDWAWVVCKYLRKVGWQHPIQVWYLGKQEMPAWAPALFEKIGAQVVDAQLVHRTHPVRSLTGWTLKNFAVMRCPWRRVLFLDADCFPVDDPSDLFTDSDVFEKGSLFFRDVKGCHPTTWAYQFCGLLPKVEWETGQFLIDKQKAWEGLKLTSWMNEHDDVWFKLVHGDKGTFELGFRTSHTPHILSDRATWEGWGVGQWYKDRMRFMHSMAYKRGEHKAPDPIIPAYFEEWRSLRP